MKIQLLKKRIDGSMYMYKVVMGDEIVTITSRYGDAKASFEALRQPSVRPIAEDEELLEEFDI